MAQEKQETESEIINETDTTTVLSVENEEKDLISQPKKRRSTSRSSAIKSLGVYEKLKSRVELFKGKFGFYIKCNNKNYSLPKSYENPETLTLKDAIAVIEKKTKS